ncbi:hypothetical protein ACFY8B_36020 [Streptomyces sp. NPDC012751]|uniref:hypothetical protein n=1 Tax=Streptomyces sp. NPDC012751 TaxID=3364846 RepID=UPI0036CD8DFB
MMEEAPASSDETDEKEAAERRRKRHQTCGQILLDWSPVLARLVITVMQHLS